MDTFKQYLSGMQMRHHLSWPAFNASATAASDALNGHVAASRHHDDAVLSKSPVSLANVNSTFFVTT